MNISRSFLHSSLLLSSLIALSVDSVAQEPPNPKASGTTTRLSLIVTNPSNHSIDEVSKGDVHVFQGGVPQALTFFERDERPIDYAIAVDNSGSFRPILAASVLASRILIDSNRPTDETFIERFISSNKIERVQDFTTDKADLKSKLEDLFIEAGQSAVVDALYLATDHVAKYRPNENRRKAVVVFTDCEERASYYSTDKLVKLIHETNVQIFLIAVVELLGKQPVAPGVPVIKNSRAKAEKLAKRLAEESGGRYFFPKDGKEMKFAVDEIIHDLHSEFLLGYEQTSKPKKNPLQITVSIKTESITEQLTATARILQ